MEKGLRLCSSRLPVLVRTSWWACGTVTRGTIAMHFSVASLRPVWGRVRLPALNVFHVAAKHTSNQPSSHMLCCNGRVCNNDAEESLKNKEVYGVEDSWKEVSKKSQEDTAEIDQRESSGGKERRQTRLSCPV